VNDLFFDVVENDKAREQKEELCLHLTERVNDYMAAGLTFDEAFEAAKDGLGDTEELISGFERKRAIVFDDLDEDYGIHFQARFKKVRFKGLMVKLVSLAPFIYIIMGVTQHIWAPDWWTWGWWTWGWVIIPIAAIVSNGFGLNSIVALSPFAYVLMGIFFGWWAWGWLIIPVSGILFTSDRKKKKRRRKAKDIDGVIEIEKDGKLIKIDKIAGTVDIIETDDRSN